MKKFALLLLFAISGSLFLVSCNGGDDNDPGTPKPKPTISFKTGGNYTSSNTTKQAGQDIDFGVIATPSSGEKISRVKVTLSVNGGPEAVLADSNNIKLTSYTNDWTAIKVGNLPNAQNKYTATVTQTNGESSSVSFVVTVTAPPKPVQETGGIQLGAQNNSSIGSFFDPEQGNGGIMLYAAAKANQSKVHIIYYSGTTNKETFSAPNDPQITQVFSDMSSWTTRNATVFKKTTMTSTQFDNIDPANSTAIDNECTSGVFTSKITQLKVGDVIAYRSQTGSLYGLMRIAAIDAGGSGDITFDMKNPTF